MVTQEEYERLRDRMIKLEGQVAYLYRHLGVTFVPEAAPGDDPRIIEHLKKGDLLGAIKVHREIYNSDLNAAKASVEETKGRLGL